MDASRTWHKESRLRRALKLWRSRFGSGGPDALVAFSALSAFFTLSAFFALYALSAFFALFALFTLSALSALSDEDEIE